MFSMNGYSKKKVPLLAEEAFAQRENGFVALTVLWILVILSMLAVGLGRQTSVDVALAKHELERFKGKYLAWAGLVYAIDQIHRDNKDATTKQFDTLYQCGISLPSNTTVEKLFRHISLGDGYFDVGYPSEASNDSPFYYGLQDEESKINLNGLNPLNYKALSQLIVLLGFEEQRGDRVAFAVIDWKDQDDHLSDNNFGAEDSYYMSLTKPYHCKNRPFDSVEELLLVRDMNPELFAKIKNYVTVYPKQGNLLVNFETAPLSVLRGLARGTTFVSGTGLSTADGVANKIVNYRRGNDGLDMTPDDRRVNLTELALTQEEQIIFLNMSAMRAGIANHLRVNVHGKANTSSRGVDLTAVVARSDFSILYWRREE